MWSNIRLGTRLVIGFLIVIIMACAVGLLGIRAESQTKAGAAIIQDCNALEITLLQARRAEKNFIIRGDNSYVDQTKAAITECKNLTQKISSEFKNEQIPEICNKVNEALDRYSAAFQEYVDLTNTNADVFTAWKQIGVDFGALVDTMRMDADRGSDVYIQADTLETKFELMRVAALYFIKDRTNSAWDSFEAAMKVTQDEAQKLTDMSGSNATLVNSAATIENQIQKYVQNADLYHDNVLKQTADDTEFVNQGRLVEGSADQTQDAYGGSILIAALASHDMETNQKSSIIMIIAFLTVAVINGLLITVIIVRSVTKPIKLMVSTANEIADQDLAALAESAGAIAKGDLTHSVNITTKDITFKSHDEMGELAAAFNKMTVNIREAGDSFEKMVSNLRESITDAQTKVEYLNNIPSPVLAVDKEMNVVFINPAGVKALGRTEQECLGQKCFDICTSNHCNTPKCRIVQAMEKDGVFTGDTLATIPTGKLSMRYTGAPLKDANGNIVGAIKAITDINEEAIAVTQVQEIVSAVSEGRLDVRGNPDVFNIAGFKKVINGINMTLDTVVGPISEVNRVTGLIAAGDLTSGVNGNYKGVFNSLKDSVNTMLANLIVLVRQLKEQADKLSAASEQLSRTSAQAGQATQQIATTSQQVAKGAIEQSTSLNQTTQGIEQLSRAIQQISAGAQEQAKGVERNVEIVNQVSSAISGVTNNAQEASEGAKKAGEAAQQGADMIHKTVEGMGRIKQSSTDVSAKIADLGERSKEIGKIVATIDDIAAQTNLLALNAAIEAARAGDQGRGFAVVADEVRKLAERSSNATKEIAELITSIQNGVNQAIKAMAGGSKEVEDGFKLASEAGESLTDILKTVKEVNTQVGKITGAARALNSLSSEMVKVTDSVSSVVEENTAATEEMSASSSQVSQSIEAVLGVSQGNNTATQEVSAAAEEMSAQVEEVVASAQSLAQMARGLQESVAAFKLSDDDNRKAKPKNK
jgi:methyl-accepting chemotaxis protein